ncbi:hypothetical protein [Isoptericola chiayiensis]|uniref:hypothetical protein n=1 Tax=Isoptericola chiayiensis TaxID=579446 RepID=UPI0015565466|nr:hypothetical protein [Isoptericola chiayiensis]NOW00768.1 hypothetical protein [Isoptericola chiayiensis]
MSGSDAVAAYVGRARLLDAALPRVSASEQVLGVLIEDGQDAPVLPDTVAPQAGSLGEHSRLGELVQRVLGGLTCHTQVVGEESCVDDRVGDEVGEHPPGDCLSPEATEKFTGGVDLGCQIIDETGSREGSEAGGVGEPLDDRTGVAVAVA